jgi:hypothetical protein
LEKPCFFYPDQSEVEGGERGVRAGKRLDETGGKRTGAVPATAFSNLTNSPIRKPLPAAEVRRVSKRKEENSVVDLNLLGSALILVGWFRIRIQEGKNYPQK